MLLLEVCHAVVQIVHTVGGLGNGQHLGNVDNGAAADRAAAKRGEYGMLPHDILPELGALFAENQR